MGARVLGGPAPQALWSAVVSVRGRLFPAGTIVRATVEVAVRAVWNHPRTCAGVVGIGLLLQQRGGSIVDAVRRRVGPRLFAYLVDATTLQLINAGARRRFRQLVMAAPKPRGSGHSHPKAANDRTNASDAIDQFILGEGFLPFSVSMSDRDDRNGLAGTHGQFFTKDAAMATRWDTLGSQHMLKMIDVDYYLDIGDLVSRGHTVLMYTFVPDQVAGTTVEATYTIDEHDVCHTRGAGGSEYHHKLWDYDGDCITADYWWGSVVFLCESQLTGYDDRRIIGLFPVRTIIGPLGWLLPGRRFKRREFNVGAVQASRWQNDDGVSISLGRPEDRFSVDIAERHLRAIVVRMANKKKVEANIGDVERMVMSYGYPEPQTMAPLLFDMIQDLKNTNRKEILTPTGLAELLKPPTKEELEADEIHYQTLNPLITEDGDPTSRVVGPNFMSGGGNVVPVQSRNNDESCVENRITKVRNTVTTWPTAWHKFANEFIERLIPADQVHTGAPRSITELMEIQSRPTQRAGADAVHSSMFTNSWHRMIKAFQKREGYKKIGAPRNIATFDADHRTRYGGFTYPMTEKIFKGQKWYAFSKVPVEIADRVEETCREALWITTTDFTAFDGTHSYPLVEKEVAAAKRFFHPCYHAELEELIRSQYDAPGITKLGVKYNIGPARSSGSSDTSMFNTFDNALIMFICLREQGWTADYAWSRLGLFGGDDGIQGDLDVAVAVKVTKKMGHIIKPNYIKRGQPVDFLGRYYLDPWTTNASVIDVLRQAMKLHITHCSSLVPATTALYCKALGLDTTDHDTPLIGNWARKVREILERDNGGAAALTTQLTTHSDELKTDRKWFAQYDSQFPQLSIVDALAMDFAAKAVGLTVSELYVYMEQIDRARTLAEIPEHFIHRVMPVEIPAVIAGEVVEPPKPKEGEAPVAPAHNSSSQTNPAPNGSNAQPPPGPGPNNTGPGVPPPRGGPKPTGNPPSDSGSVRGSVRDARVYQRPSRWTGTVHGDRAKRPGGKTLAHAPQRPPARSPGLSQRPGTTKLPVVRASGTSSGSSASEVGRGIHAERSDSSGSAGSGATPISSGVHADGGGGRGGLSPVRQ
jgi:hypothetical protein